MEALIKFELEKKIWTETDFKVMGWHDNPIYGLSLGGDHPFIKELMLDIDYIFEWIHPIVSEQTFSFWIAPATLCFKDVSNVKINIENGPTIVFDLEIADIFRLEQTPIQTGSNYWEWHIELQNGSISFLSSGYEQIIKGEPILTGSQCVPKVVRGEPNFKRIPFE